MKRLAWWLRGHGAAFALAVGLALLLSAVLGHWFAVEPLARDVAALSRAPGTRDALHQRMDESLQRAATPQVRLAAFARHFADDPALGARLTRLHALAGAHGLEFKRGDYRLAPGGERGLARYRMEVPIQGRYPSIRAFVSSVLQEMPTLSIEQLQFQRRNVADEQVEALVVFTLFIAP
jgi:hypothetical protein